MLRVTLLPSNFLQLTATSDFSLLSNGKMNDRELVSRVIRRDHHAFRELISLNQRLVEHMIGRLIDNEEDREELCQDVFLKVYESLPSFKFDCKLSTWIATIAYRKAVNFLRKSKRKGEQQDLEKVDFQLGRSDFSFENTDYAHFIRTLIAQMPVQYKTILTLYHLDGFSYQEIMEVMGLPEGTVKNYLFRARAKLKELSEPLIGKEIF